MFIDETIFFPIYLIINLIWQVRLGSFKIKIFLLRVVYIQKMANGEKVSLFCSSMYVDRNLVVVSVLQGST